MKRSGLLIRLLTSWGLLALALLLTACGGGGGGGEASAEERQQAEAALAAGQSWDDPADDYEAVNTFAPWPAVDLRRATLGQDNDFRR